MKEFTPIATRHKNQVEGMAPFIFAIELQTIEVTPRRYRMTNFDKRLYWGHNSEGDPIDYYPVPMAVGDLESTSTGDLPTVNATIANTGTFPILTVDANNGFGGSTARVLVLSTLDLDSGVALIDEDIRVVGSSMTHEGVDFSLSGSELFRSVFPKYTYGKRSCKWPKFGSAYCGYNLGAASPGFQDCGLTVGGVEVARPFSLQACQLVGDDEVAQGVTRQHPNRFGAEPGIPNG